MLSKEQVKEVHDIVSEILRGSPVECTSTVTADQVHVHFADITYRIFADKIAYRSPGGNWVEKPLDQWAESSSRGGWTKEALKIANEIKVRIDPVESALDLPFEFRDQARCILQSHAVGQSVEEAEKTCITEDGFARIYASELVIVIQPEEEVMHISMLKPNPETHTHGLTEWENMDAEDFPRGIYGYVWWTQNLKPALFEIIELLERNDTSSELTFEDQVISVLEKHNKGYAKFRLTEQGLKINFNAAYVVLGDGGWDRVKVGNNPEKTFSRAGLKRQVENKINGNALGWWGNHSPVILEIIELLEAQRDDDTPPITTEAETIMLLRKQIEVLQRNLKEETERREKWETVYQNSDQRSGRLLKEAEELQGRLKREGDAASFTEGKLAACEKELRKLKEEHLELNEKYINHSSVYENKIEQQEERICKLIDRLKLYQAAYEQEFLKSMEPKKGVTSDS